MNFKIKVYCILLTIVYLVITASSIYYGSSDFIAGFEKGTDRNFSTEIYYLNLEPEKGKYSFDETARNEKTGQIIPIEAKSCIIKTDSSYGAIPAGLKTIKVTCMAFIVVLAFCLLFSPILFFSIIYSITKNRIITKSLILRSRVLGWLMISFSVIEIISTINETYILRHIVKLENYQIVMGQQDYMMLVLGLVILILAEILKVSLKMKEEQDLTI